MSMKNLFLFLSILYTYPLIYTSEKSSCAKPKAMKSDSDKGQILLNEIIQSLREPTLGLSQPNAKDLQRSTKRTYVQVIAIVLISPDQTKS